MSWGRLGNGVLAAVVAAVLALAALDAVRQARVDEAGDPPGTTASVVSDPLAAAGLAGELILVADEGCRRRTIRLPRLRPGPSEPGCSLEHASPRPEGASLVAREELERAARRHPNVPLDAGLDFEVADVAWLSRTRVVVRLSIRVRGRLARIGPQPLVAFFESGRVVHTTSLFRDARARLLASPGGRYVAFAPGIVLRRDGSEASLPGGLVQARAVAWSPDGRWLALAQRGSIALVEVASLERHDRTGGGLRTLDVPVAARDLLWR